MTRTSIIAALVLGLLATPAFATGGWWDDVYEQKTVTLEAILENPVAFRGLDVSFVVQFHQLGTIENPYYTPFEKERYVNFTVWSDAAAIWDKKSYREDFPYMFIDRIAKESAMVLKAKTYSRFLVTGRVESIFRGKPWIEVVGLEALPEKITEPVLIRMVKAYKLKGARRFDAAASEFGAALVKNLPTHIGTTLNRERGFCLAAAEKWTEAIPPLEKAFAMLPKDVALESLIARCRSEIAPRAKEGEAEGDVEVGVKTGK